MDQPPEGEGWIHEVKFDGYRAQVIVQDGTARVYTRNGHDWSAKFWPIALAAQAPSSNSAI
ncbi:MAG: ATP-dependent DNA ligase, partial [Mesorhizobium sp.]